MRLSLGINNAFAVKRWPRAADWISIVREELDLRVVQHSFDLVDLSLGSEELKSEAESLAITCRENDVFLHSTFTGLVAYSSNMLLHPDQLYREQAIEWWKTALQYTAHTGAMAAGGHIGAYSVPDWKDPIRRAHLDDSLRTSLDLIRSYAYDLGIPDFVIENLASPREPSTTDVIESLLDDSREGRSSVKLCLDIGHQCVPGTRLPETDPYYWLERFGQNASMIHIQQSDENGDRHWPFTEEYNERGRIQATSVLKSLEQGGATDVTLVLECLPSFEQDDDHVLRDLIVSVDYWKTAIAEYER